MNLFSVVLLRFLRAEKVDWFVSGPMYRVFMYLASASSGSGRFSAFSFSLSFFDGVGGAAMDLPLGPSLERGRP